MDPKRLCMLWTACRLLSIERVRKRLASHKYNGYQVFEQIFVNRSALKSSGVPIGELADDPGPRRLVIGSFNKTSAIMRRVSSFDTTGADERRDARIFGVPPCETWTMGGSSRLQDYKSASIVYQSDARLVTGLWVSIAEKEPRLDISSWWTGW